MRDSLFHLNRKPNISIQGSIREMLVSAILNRQLPPGDALPSSRQMAKILGVSRNTVVLAYQALVDDGYLLSRERSGFYVNPEMIEDRAGPLETVPRALTDAGRAEAARAAVDWSSRFRVNANNQAKIPKPRDWQTFPYPFLYGQVDQGLFPISAWRECSRQALGRRGLDAWTSDTQGADDPALLEQIRTRLLPRRGVFAGEDEILVTLGAQNALYLLAELLAGVGVKVALEDPGYPDARNIFQLKTDMIYPVPVDGEGLPVDGRLRDCDLVYVTPSHQFPTTVTMPRPRREELLRRAENDDFLIIEDDYEWETNYVAKPTVALKSLDRTGRVIYIGSLSKTLFPGLRLGYMVAPAPLIGEARALRHLMFRHAPNNNQRTAALFLSLGHHDSLVHRLQKTYRERWRVLRDALDRRLTDWATAPAFGGTAFWVTGPGNFDADALAEQALDEGVIIEPGGACHARGPIPKNHFRLGFSSIPTERIEPGIERLAGIIRRGEE